MEQGCILFCRRELSINLHFQLSSFLLNEEMPILGFLIYFSNEKVSHFVLLSVVEIISFSNKHF